MCVGGGGGGFQSMFFFSFFVGYITSHSNIPCTQKEKEKEKGGEITSCGCREPDGVTYEWVLYVLTLLWNQSIASHQKG